MKIKVSDLPSHREAEKSYLGQDEVKTLDQRYEVYREALEHMREQIRDALGYYMKKHAISFTALQKSLNISATTLSRVIKGTGNPTIETLALIAAALNIEWKLECRSVVGKNRGLGSQGAPPSRAA